MVWSSKGMSDLILGAVESREAFRKALAQNSMSESTEARCAERTSKIPDTVKVRETLGGRGELDGQGRQRQIEGESRVSDSEPGTPSSSCDAAVLERLRVMLCELARKPTDKDLLQMAKAEVRNEWFTEDGKVFRYRNMESGLPDFKVPSVDSSFILLAGKVALRDLFYRCSLFDSVLLPQLERVMMNDNILEEEKVRQMVFLRHHSPVALRPKVGRLLDDVPFAKSFVFHWELFASEKSDDLLNVALKDLDITSMHTLCS